ncbi:LytTR family transcriptional regulator DNA-binding domain-containing protein [Pseudomonas resinovorans]|uniref:LytTR family transcriptional regulator DNA-binding domain-containing protein n=1 Tax=Metapseudomonas resinovorans TaxID=53412 RepID=A0ABT4Y8L0_METRE|nr:LytTR family transcriptional regulator DNA-binding domain-containing protein [Pseudomonas resinovorans]MDA8485128.1 LytTR family transcriptional regulator DNA-binding domain-containing protein [Pseudomonas resinovorans]
MSRREHLSAWYRDRRISVPVESVTHFSTDLKYTIAHHPNGELMLLDSLVKLAREFPEFICIHRGMLARKSLITRFREHRPVTYHGADGGFVQVEGVGELRVSRSRTPVIKELLRSFP